MKMPLELLPTHGVSCSPAEYIRLVRSVRSVRIQPPRLGEPGFGSLLAEYRTPVFRAPADER